VAKVSKKKGATRKPVRKERQAITWNWTLWLRHLFVLTVITAVVFSIYWLKQDQSLPVLYVTVDGKFEHVNKDKLVAAVTPHVTGNFINVDVAKLREAGEAAPWVKQIQVQRHWPDTVHLIVEEQVAIAAWGKKALINDEGDLFFPEKLNLNKGLVHLDGPEGTNKMMMKRYIAISKVLSSVDLGIKNMKIDKRHSWLINLSNGITLKLGRADSEQRLARFIQIYNAGLAKYIDEIETVDMRYTNGLAVNWKSGQQPEFNGAV